MAALDVFALILSVIVFFGIQYLSLILSAKILIRDKRLLGKEFKIEAVKISAISAAIAGIMSLLKMNYIALIIIAAITLLLIKHFLGEGITSKGWDKAALLWIIWLGIFLVLFVIMSLISIFAMKLAYTNIAMS